MNKYQEALDNAINDIEYKHYDFGVDVPKERLDEIKLLQKLVDKEKPRYVNYEYDGYADGCPVCDTAYCPECGRYFDLDCEEKCNYCPDCGQRLNWEFRELEEEKEEE